MTHEARHLPSLCPFNLLKLVCIRAIPNNSRMLLQSNLMKISFWKRKNTNICFPHSSMRLFLVLSFLVQIIQSHWEKIVEFYQRNMSFWNVGEMYMLSHGRAEDRWNLNDRKQLPSKKSVKLLRWLCNYSKMQRVAVAQSQDSSYEGNCSSRSMPVVKLKGYLKSICQKGSCGLKVWFLFFPSILERGGHAIHLPSFVSFRFVENGLHLCSSKQFHVCCFSRN